MRIPPRRFRCPVSLVLALAMLSSGCASAIPSRASFGVRPDVPVGAAPPEARDACAQRGHPDKSSEFGACLEFETLVQWSAALQEAYLSRASQNRWWIYVAGTIGLGALAAGGGLAAAGAASLTLALLSVSGGFASGFFAFLNNSQLADMYTIAAAEVTTARASARQAIDDALATRAGQQMTPVYYTQAGILRKMIADTENTLEAARTSNAVTALAKRASEEQAKLQQELNRVKTARAAQVVLRGQITAINGATTASVTAGTASALVLTVTNVNLDGIARREMSVGIGERKQSVEGVSQDLAQPTIWNVLFTPPATPEAGVADYAPRLLLGDEVLATAAAGVKLTYQ